MKSALILLATATLAQAAPLGKVRRDVTVPEVSATCGTCSVDPTYDACDPTTSCIFTFGFDYQCACRAGFKSNSTADSYSPATSWRINGTLLGFANLVFVAPGTACDTTCDSTAGPDICSEVPLADCIAANDSSVTSPVSLAARDVPYTTLIPVPVSDSTTSTDEPTSSPVPSSSPDATATCTTCAPDPLLNLCDASTSCIGTQSFGTQCACRAGFKTNSTDGQWRLDGWAGYQGLVFVAPGAECNTPCDAPDASTGSIYCAEVPVDSFCPVEYTATESASASAAPTLYRRQLPDVPAAVTDTVPTSSPIGTDVAAPSSSAVAAAPSSSDAAVSSPAASSDATLTVFETTDAPQPSASSSFNSSWSASLNFSASANASGAVSTSISVEVVTVTVTLNATTPSATDAATDAANATETVTETDTETVTESATESETSDVPSSTESGTDGAPISVITAAAEDAIESASPSASPSGFSNSLNATEMVTGTVIPYATTETAAATAPWTSVF
ncbi:hypothetical protein HK405_003312 [Cladochytrium tenue]|nr:hypothetical protein HK405_003312 [Cladochytrium tenue]